MRIFANFRSRAGRDGLADMQRFFSDHSLLPVEDLTERRVVLDELLEDMSANDRRRFQRTLRHVAQDPSGGTIGSISVLPEGYLVVRLRNATLQKLMPGGHRLIHSVMHEHGPNGTDDFELRDCEVRERGREEAFLYGSWRGGERSYFRFLFSERRAYFVATLFVLGLALEIALSFADVQTGITGLGARLGAPMLVSSLVLLLERLAQWRDQREPQLRWDTAPPPPSRRHEAFQVSPAADVAY